MKMRAGNRDSNAKPQSIRYGFVGLPNRKRFGAGFVNGDTTQSTSSVGLVTRKHLTKTEFLSCEPVNFHGPVRINDQSHGNRIALVVFNKTKEGSAPVATHVCIYRKSKVATTETPAASQVFRIAEGQEQQQSENQQNEQNEGAFFISGQTHEFQGSLNRARDALELSLRSRCGFSDETHWTAVAIPRPKYATVTNNSAEMVSCTVKNRNDARGELLTPAGLALALLGLLAGVPQAFCAVVAIGGLSLAAESWKDMMWINDTKNDESTAMLFPGDKIRHVVGGWGPFENDYDIITMQNHVEEHTNTSGGPEWTVKRIRDSGTSTQMVHLPLELLQEMVQRRLLFIDGLKPSGSSNPSKSPPFALEEGSVLSYNTAFKSGQGIYDCWYSNSYWGEQSDTLSEANEEKKIAIVQGPDSHFKPAGYCSTGYHVRHFGEDPFTPVLELTRCCYIKVPSSERETARRLIGRVDGSAGAIELIEKSEKREKNTRAYHLQKVARDTYDLYAWAWKKSLTIRSTGGDRVYFVVRKWSPAKRAISRDIWTFRRCQVPVSWISR
ncbi:uncharacterized protein Triagg1_6390 [Trichoderma aggressivum f. europaeum]|uniref:Uncharacterized protein n=1 Tax=Trichoderma aggressivum f. europaeum TaxID=173218 RepID=A0AAE1IB50_9HYPO|nr:hypothetical protein Triagg1_6390 [Trichoderma aggressivum f. europaeum]